MDTFRQQEEHPFGVRRCWHCGEGELPPRLSTEEPSKRRSLTSGELKKLIPKPREWGHRVHVVYSAREAADVLANYGIRPA